MLYRFAMSKSPYILYLSLFSESDKVLLRMTSFFETGTTVYGSDNDYLTKLDAYDYVKLVNDKESAFWDKYTQKNWRISH